MDSITKLWKEGSFLRVRSLLTEELIETINSQSLLIGTGVNATELDEAYKRMSNRVNNKKHLKKINYKH